MSVKGGLEVAVYSTTYGGYPEEGSRAGFGKRPGHMIYARSKGFRASDKRVAVSPATRNPMRHTVRRRAGPRRRVGRARPVAPPPARWPKVQTHLMDERCSDAE